MKTQNKAKGLLPILAVALVVQTAFPVAVHAVVVRNFTATIAPVQPTPVYSDTTRDYTLTIATSTDSDNKMGCAMVTVPTGFTVNSVGTPVASNGTPWSADSAGGAITLWASPGRDKLASGQSVSVTFSATTADRTYSVSVDPTSASVAQGNSTTASVSVGVDPAGDLAPTWTTVASNETPVTSTTNWNWALTGNAPSVTVRVPTVTLSATGQPTGVTIGFSPASGTPAFPSEMTIDVASTASPGTYTITIEVKIGTVVKASCTFTLTITSSGGGDGFEGLSHGYWKNHTGDWAPTSFTATQTLESVFDIPDSFGLDNATLLAALGFKGGDTLAEKAQLLLMQAVAAVLNAAHPNIDYPLTVSQIVTQVNTALGGTADDILTLKNTLDGYNNLGGDITQ